MKAYGDIPEADRQLVHELTILESWFYHYASDLPVLSISKGFVCMAHDYYSMWMEEEGIRLLLLVEKMCPGYFSGPMLVQAEKDGDFFNIIEGLKQTPALETMKTLGFEDYE